MSIARRLQGYCSLIAGLSSSLPLISRAIHAWHIRHLVERDFLSSVGETLLYDGGLLQLLLINPHRCVTRQPKVCQAINRQYNVIQVAVFKLTYLR